MTQYLGSCGTIKNFVTEDQLAGIIKIFKKMSPSEGYGNNGYYGIGPEHRAYLWFRKVLLDRIAEHFNPNIKLIFGMLLDCQVPLVIHNDLKDIPDPEGKHYLSFLIPYSVDNDPDLCDSASTLIFDPCSQENHDVSYLHANKLSHVPIEDTYQHSLREELIWSCGDLLWWSSELYHTSNNFLKTGHQSKQGIVIHTYVV
jgi:hypothetical protein